MVQFRSDSTRGSSSGKAFGSDLADRLFVPVYRFHGRLIAIADNLAADEVGEEDVDSGFQSFFSHSAAKRLLDRHERLYGPTPGWEPLVVTLHEYLKRSDDNGPSELRRTMKRTARRRESLAH